MKFAVLFVALIKWEAIDGFSYGTIKYGECHLVYKGFYRPSCLDYYESTDLANLVYSAGHIYKMNSNYHYMDRVAYESIMSCEHDTNCYVKILTEAPKLYDMTIFNLSLDQLSKIDTGYVYNGYYYRFGRKFIQRIIDFKNIKDEETKTIEKLADTLVTNNITEITIDQGKTYVFDRRYQVIRYNIDNSCTFHFARKTQVTINRLYSGVVYLQFDGFVEILGVDTKLLLLYSEADINIRFQSENEIDLMFDIKYPVKLGYNRILDCIKLVITGKYKLGFYNYENLAVGKSQKKYSIEACLTDVCKEIMRLESIDSIPYYKVMADGDGYFPLTYNYDLNPTLLTRFELSQITKEDIFMMNDNTLVSLINRCKDLYLSSRILLLSKSIDIMDNRWGYNHKMDLSEYECFNEIYKTFEAGIPAVNLDTIKISVLWSFVAVLGFDVVINFIKK